MAEPFLPRAVAPPDFYLAAMGRSGSTMIANWLSSPPDQIVFLEPSFLRLPNTRLLRIQLENLGLGPDDDQWKHEDKSASARFARLMAPRLTGRQWAVKEVLCTQHVAAIERLHPQKVLISVRDIFDVALSFFEKHRLQGNLARFSDDWVADYCTRESAGLLKLRDELVERSVPFEIVRYEDFTQSEESRNSVASFVGWRGGGQSAAHLVTFDRGFEVERHGTGISAERRRSADRALDVRLHRFAQAIAAQCADYQRAFGYQPDARLAHEEAETIRTGQ